MSLVQPPVAFHSGHHHAITTFTEWSSQCFPGSVAPTFSGAWPTADLALYVPVRVKQRVVIRKLHMSCASSSGNVDLGVYNSTGTRLVSTSTQAAAIPGTYDVTDTTIGPGLYYLAMVADNATILIQRNASAAPHPAAQGVLTEQLGTGGTLPATATWAQNQTLAYYPALGMLVEATVA